MRNFPPNHTNTVFDFIIVEEYRSSGGQIESYSWILGLFPTSYLSAFRDVAFCIVNSEKWKDALRNETLDLITGNRDTPMRKLIRKMPGKYPLHQFLPQLDAWFWCHLWTDVAERVFHRCSQSNMSNSDSPNYEITFNYEFLDDMYAQWREQDSTDALSMSGGESKGDTPWHLHTKLPIVRI